MNTLDDDALGEVLYWVVDRLFPLNGRAVGEHPLLSTMALGRRQYTGKGSRFVTAGDWVRDQVPPDTKLDRNIDMFIAEVPPPSPCSMMQG